MERVDNESKMDFVDPAYKVGCILLLRKCGFSPPSSQAVLLYEKLKKCLEKNGIKIKPHWTAWELLHFGIPDQKLKQVEHVID
jgi:hypothetical protein